MNWRAWWARLSVRERQLIGAAGAVFALALVRYAILSPFLAYRESLRDEIVSHREMLQNDEAYLARSADTTRHLETLRGRYREVHAQLIPGETPTLAAASLQDTLHSLAAEKGISIQSTQVMREETVGDFRRIAVRITVTGELRQLADFLAGVEFGQRRLSIPFLEISRRGAVLRGQSARALAATVEVNAFLQGSGKDGKVEAADAATPPSGGGPAGGTPEAEGGDAPEANASGAAAAAAVSPAAAAAVSPAAPGAAGTPATSPAASGPGAARGRDERVDRLARVSSPTHTAATALAGAA